MRHLGEASVPYGDFRGTFAADKLRHDDALYELADISREHWHIVGFEMGGGPGFTRATVWAVPIEEARYEDWRTRAESGAKTVHAHEFSVQIEDYTAALKLLQIFNQWNIHALHRSLAELGLDLETTER